MTSCQCQTSQATALGAGDWPIKTPKILGDLQPPITVHAAMQAHLNQMAPHHLERKTAQLLTQARAEIERLIGSQTTPATV